MPFDFDVILFSDLESGMWSLQHKLCSIMVKQEQHMATELPETQLATNAAPMLNLNPLQRLPASEEVSLLLPEYLL